MTIEIVEQFERTNPVTHISDQELDMLILKMGSFLSIINNKKVNQAKLLIAAVNDQKFQDCFLQMAEMPQLQTLVQTLLNKYPTLCKSKVVLNAVKPKKKR